MTEILKYFMKCLITRFACNIYIYIKTFDLLQYSKLHREV